MRSILTSKLNCSCSANRKIGTFVWLIKILLGGFFSYFLSGPFILIYSSMRSILTSKLNCSCSANSHSTACIRYNPDTVGPSPPITLLASSRHVNVLLFNFADMSVVYCPQPLESGRFQSSTLLGSSPFAGIALVDSFAVEAGVAVAGGLLVLDTVWELV